MNKGKWYLVYDWFDSSWDGPHGTWEKMEIPLKAGTEEEAIAEAKSKWDEKVAETEARWEVQKKTSAHPPLSPFASGPIDPRVICICIISLQTAAPTAMVAQNITQPLPVPAVTVIAQFTLGGRPFEAVLVHQTDEDSILSGEMIRRADTDGLVVRTDAEWQFVYEHRDELPPALNNYWFVTARPYPDFPGFVWILARDSLMWFTDRESLSGRLGQYALVLRRRV
jgi:hypothetical protein